MSVQYIFGAEVSLVDEPLIVGADVSRDAGFKKTGLASYCCDHMQVDARCQMNPLYPNRGFAVDHWVVTGKAWWLSWFYTTQDMPGWLVDINDWINFYFKDAANNDWVWQLRWDDQGLMHLVDTQGLGGNVLDSSAGKVFTAATWHKIKVEINYSGRRIRFWVDGVLEIDYTHGSALPGECFDYFAWGGNGGKAGEAALTKIWWDDIWVSNSHGGVWNQDPGGDPPEETLYTPNSSAGIGHDDWADFPVAGAKHQKWDDAAGGAANDGDMTYLHADGAAVLSQTSHITDYAGAEVLDAVMIPIIAKQINGAADELQVLARQNATDAVQTCKRASAVYDPHGYLVLGQTPDGNYWTDAAFDALEIGARKLASAADAEWRVTEVYAILAVGIPHPAEVERRIFITVSN